MKLKYGNIYLCGFMGSGKTATAKALAELADMDFFDTDAETAKIMRRAPADFFSGGRRKFRAAESRAVARAARRGNLAVALGGGSLLAAANRRMVRDSGALVYLKCPQKILLRRLRGAKDRPLLRGYAGAALAQRISSLLKQRQKHYLLADFAVFSAATAPEQTAAAIMKKLGMAPLEPVQDLAFVAKMAILKPSRSAAKRASSTRGCKLSSAKAQAKSAICSRNRRF